MRKLDETLRNKLLSDPFYLKCCICGDYQRQWHHNLIFGGRQVNEMWAILPLCPMHHRMADEREFRKVLDHIMLNRATNNDLDRYSKVRDLKQERQRLNEYFAAKTKGQCL